MTILLEGRAAISSLLAPYVEPTETSSIYRDLVNDVDYLSEETFMQLIQAADDEQGYITFPVIKQKSEAHLDLSVLDYLFKEAL